MLREYQSRADGRLGISIRFRGTPSTERSPQGSGAGRRSATRSDLFLPPASCGIGSRGSTPEDPSTGGGRLGKISMGKKIHGYKRARRSYKITDQQRAAHRRLAKLRRLARLLGLPFTTHPGQSIPLRIVLPDPTPTESHPASDPVIR